MSERGRTALLVVSAQTGAAKRAKPCLDALEAGGMTLVRRDCQPARLAALILSVRDQVDCVVLAGGDAFLSAGAIALRDTGLPLGIVPVGAENDLAIMLGLPQDPPGTAATILAGHVRAVTLGSVNGLPFFTAASIGLSVSGARALARRASRPLGGMRFALAAFRLLLERRRFSAIIRCGAVVHRVRTIQITIGNGRLFYGGMPPEGPRAGAGPTLAVYSLEPAQRWGLMLMAPVFAGRADFKPTEVRTTWSPVVEVVTRLPQPISADGVEMTVTPARFSVQPNAVMVYAPPLPDGEEV